MLINRFIKIIALYFIPALILNTTVNAQSASEVTAYPTPEGLTTSPDFTVTVNNKNIWTESVGNGGMENLNVANYSASGTQTITVMAKSAIQKFAILPKSRNITGHVQGNKLTFTITGNQKLYIEIDSLPHLAIFSNPQEKYTPKPGDSNVIYYGPGYYTYRENHQPAKQSNHLYCRRGAVLNANIRGKDLNNVKILGYGILNGNVRVSGTTNLEVSGIFIRNTMGWCNTLTDCHNTLYKNVKVFSYKTVWGVDGIDPVSCKNFTIDDCFIRTRDDCVSIKSETGHGRDTVKYINTDSITVKNCTLMGWSHADGVTMGFELQGGLAQNVLIKNCDILSARGTGVAPAAIPLSALFAMARQRYKTSAMKISG